MLRKRCLAFLVMLELLLTMSLSGPVYSIHPTDLWRPNGPAMGNILFKVYSNELAEFTDLETGGLDLTDWPVPASKEASYASNMNLHLTPPVSEFAFFDIEFNLANDFWGIPMQQPRGLDSFESASTQTLTSNGVEIRRAIAHLVDKESFIADSILQGRAERIDNPIAPAHGLCPPKCPDVNAWDNLHTTISAYNIAPDTGRGGFPAEGSPDFKAARDHLLQVRDAQGRQVFFDANNDGVIDNPPTSRIIFYIRIDDPPRHALGVGLAQTIEKLFGGADVIDERFVDIQQVANIVFGTLEPFDWHLYTGSPSTRGPFQGRLGSFWDHLYQLYFSQFASDLCGGPKSIFATNYIFACLPQLDQEGQATVFSSTLTGSANAAVLAMDLFGRNVVAIPVYSPTSRFVYRAGWGGVINQVGIGPPNSFTLLNMSPDGTRSDTPAIPDTLRFGLRQGTGRLSLFHSQTVWEFLILTEIYDSLLAQNPRNPLQIFDWMTNSHRVFLNPTSTGLGYTPPPGTGTSLRFFMKNQLFWHDGLPLTAQDVRFSMLNYRDVPSANLAPFVSRVIDVRVLTETIVDVHLAGTSTFYELNIGLIPILPKHIWDKHGASLNDPPDGVADPEKVDLNLDPMAAGFLVGSGPFMCLDLDTGKAGGSCSQTAAGQKGGQSVGPGGRFLLTRFPRYMRGPSTFAEFSWADKNNDALVNILDIASAAICFDQPATGSCAYWNRPSPIGIDPSRIDIGEIAAVAVRFDETLVSPFSWSQLTDIAPFTP